MSLMIKSHLSYNSFKKFYLCCIIKKSHQRVVALGSSYKHFLGLPSVRVFCILCCVRLLSLYYLNSAKSDITIDQFLRSILLRFFIEKIKTLYSINFISDII